MAGLQISNCTRHLSGTAELKLSFLHTIPDLPASQFNSLHYEQLTKSSTVLSAFLKETSLGQIVI